MNNKYMVLVALTAISLFSVQTGLMGTEAARRNKEREQDQLRRQKSRAEQKEAAKQAGVSQGMSFTNQNPDYQTEAYTRGSMGDTRGSMGEEGVYWVR